MCFRAAEAARWACIKERNDQSETEELVSFLYSCTSLRSRHSDEIFEVSCLRLPLDIGRTHICQTIDIYEYNWRFCFSFVLWVANCELWDARVKLNL